MGSLFTSLSKIISLKTFLIFTGIILYLDIYYILVKKSKLSENFVDLLDINFTIKILFIYLALVTIIVPIFSVLIVFFISILSDGDVTFFDRDYYYIEEIKEKSIKENNYVLFKIYLEKNEQYKEKQEIYKYSFLIVIIVFYAFFNGIFIDKLIIYDLLFFLNLITTDENKLTYLFFLGIPFLFLIYFSYKYIISIEVKLIKWIVFSNKPKV